MIFTYQPTQTQTVYMILDKARSQQNPQHD